MLDPLDAAARSSPWRGRPRRRADRARSTRPARGAPAPPLPDRSRARPPAHQRSRGRVARRERSRARGWRRRRPRARAGVTHARGRGGERRLGRPGTGCVEDRRPSRWASPAIWPPGASCPSRTRRRPSTRAPEPRQRAQCARRRRSSPSRPLSGTSGRRGQHGGEFGRPPARRPATGPGAGSPRAGAAAPAPARRRSPPPACVRAFR